MDFVIGAVIGSFIASMLATGLVNSDRKQEIEKACQGKSWVIEEPLIKKTLTCTVEIKDKK